jgi:glyoxylase-like metal-dependent hydrolase (beta-lactamase superfamily II)
VSDLRVERVVTTGVFSLDGEDHDVQNNVWLVGDDTEVLVIDAAHDAKAILDAVGDRQVLAVVCTHGHNDHIDAAVELASAADCEIALHPGDQMLWAAVHDDVTPDIDLAHGGAFEIAGARVDVLHTPGHTPGGVCLYVGDDDIVFTGDTLFHGGPGATGRSFSDFPTILRSIRERLLELPPQTRVLPGHGDETTIGDEAADYDAWVERGH